MQKYLIDTQILIWALIFPEKLSTEIQAILSNNFIYASQISFLEIAIKQKLGKLPELPLSIPELQRIVKNDGFELIPLEITHISSYHIIPLFPVHKDPFDRLLLATAFNENLLFISSDKNFKLYQNLVHIVQA